MNLKIIYNVSCVVFWGSMIMKSKKRNTNRQCNRCLPNRYMLYSYMMHKQVQIVDGEIQVFKYKDANCCERVVKLSEMNI